MILSTVIANHKPWRAQVVFGFLDLASQNQLSRDQFHLSTPLQNATDGRLTNRALGEALVTCADGKVFEGRAAKQLIRLAHQPNQSTLAVQYRLEFLLTFPPLMAIGVEAMRMFDDLLVTSLSQRQAVEAVTIAKGHWMRRQQTAKPENQRRTDYFLTYADELLTRLAKSWGSGTFPSGSHLSPLCHHFLFP